MIDHNTARIAQIQQFCRLVERFTGCVITGLTDELKGMIVFHDINMRMSTGNHQRHKGKPGFFICKKGGHDMSLNVIDPHKWNIEPVGQRLGRR